MKTLLLTPVKSTSAPNMMGRTKPPRPPIKPTMPEMTPMFCGYSSDMYLKTYALPNAQATPMVNSSTVNIHQFKPMLIVRSPSIVLIVSSVCG